MQIKDYLDEILNLIAEKFKSRSHIESYSTL